MKKPTASDCSLNTYCTVYDFMRPPAVSSLEGVRGGGGGGEGL